MVDERVLLQAKLAPCVDHHLDMGMFGGMALVPVQRAAFFLT